MPSQSGHRKYSEECRAWSASRLNHWTRTSRSRGACHCKQLGNHTDQNPIRLNPSRRLSSAVSATFADFSVYFSAFCLVCLNLRLATPVQLLWILRLARQSVSSLPSLLAEIHIKWASPDSNFLTLSRPSCTRSNDRRRALPCGSRLPSIRTQVRPHSIYLRGQNQCRQTCPAPEGIQSDRWSSYAATSRNPFLCGSERAWARGAALWSLDPSRRKFVCRTHRTSACYRRPA